MKQPSAIKSVMRNIDTSQVQLLENSALTQLAP